MIALAAKSAKKVDVFMDSVQRNLKKEQQEEFLQSIGGSSVQKIKEWLGGFINPEEAILDQVAKLRQKPYIPSDLIIHGLLYDVVTDKVEVVLDGYEEDAY